MISSYYQLTKPGIVRGNLFSAAAGFFLASGGNIDVFLFLSVILGTIFVIASGCVFNNYIDRGIDAKMERTKKRPLVAGVISGKNALVYGTILGLLSLFIFSFFTNFLTVRVALAGFIFYVVMYGYFKRRSIYGTLVGSISGAIPPVIGYTAVTQRVDFAAVLLFFILVAWQMPHFYAIGIYRLEEYKKAGLPILSIIKGIHLTKTHIVFYIIAFIILSSMMTVFGYTGFLYLIVILIVGLNWLMKALRGFSGKEDSAWAKSIFSYSLLVLLVFCATISIDFILPF